MNRIVVKSRVGSDGILQLTLPVESADAGQEVQVTVEPVRPLAQPTGEWRRVILGDRRKVAGGIRATRPGRV